MNQRNFALVIALSYCVVALGQEPGTQTNPLEEVTVTATKLPTPIVEVPAAVTVRTSEDIDREVANDIKDLVRYEPGVSVRNQAGRFGLEGFTIRGIGGNRVAVEVDGVRLADAFSIGDFSNAGRNAVDIDLLKRVEIVRGSASSLYGSDALGGVVALVTKDPVDLLGDGRSFFTSAKAYYAEQNDGIGGTASFAARAGSLSGLLAYSHREGSETENAGGNAALMSLRTLPNPQESYSDSVLAKLVFDASEAQRFRVAFEQSRNDAATDVISARRTAPLPGPPPAALVETTRLSGDDEQLRRRASFEHEFDVETPLFDGGRWQIGWQASEVRQYTTEDRLTRRASGATPSRRDRRFDFDQELLNAEVTLHRTFAWGGARHELTYGFEGSRTDTEQLRTGAQVNLLTGAATNVVGPDAFPVRDFPVSRTTQLAAYAQDEIRIGRLTLLPGVRVDRYELDPEPDAIFLADNPGVALVGVEETSVSPKLGATWRFGEAWSAFGNYARSFRAPPYSDVNVGFTNLAFGYTALPNAALDPESGDSFELGIRARSGAAFLSTSAFYSRYEDFIESLVNLGVDPATGLVNFQSQNLGKVRVYGVELLAAYPLERLSSRLVGLTVRSSMSYARGENLESDQPLNSIDPPRAVVGLRYDAASGRWGSELVATLVERQDRVDDTAAPQFRSPGYATFDLLANLALTGNARLNAGVFNLFDRKHWEWADVRGRTLDDPAIDRYTRPGRAVAVNLRLEW